MKTIKIVSLLGALSLFIPFTSCTVTTDGAGGYTDEKVIIGWALSIIATGLTTARAYIDQTPASIDETKL